VGSREVHVDGEERDEKVVVDVDKDVDDDHGKDVEVFQDATLGMHHL
jgi:hypothetical protein